ncbi:MAG: nitrous oxide-stimulated promoter family protein [Bacteroidaceae bacterium]|nr:nitrous oxide-stimulated promoter family protein [Bacteroidaceae bacterium]
MSRIEREKTTVRKMIELYCRHHLGLQTVPEVYRRLDRCKFGEQKSVCKDCPIHCYAPKEREAIRRIMRWAGPRMILYAPMDTIRHLLGK